MRNTPRHSCTRLLAILFLSAATGAHAATIHTTDSSEFLSKLMPGYALQTFDSLASGVEIASPQHFSSGPFSYSASASGTFFNNSVAGDVEFSTTVYDDPITFTFTSGNVWAVGGYFWNTDVGFGVLPGTITFALSDGTAVSANSAGPASFFGFYSDAPIDWLRITPMSGQSAYATVDDLYVGQTPSRLPLQACSEDCRPLRFSSGGCGDPDLSSVQPSTRYRNARGSLTLQNRERQRADALRRLSANRAA